MFILKQCIFCLSLTRRNCKIVGTLLLVSSLLLLLLFIESNFVNAEYRPTHDNFVTYKDPLYCLMIDYPSDWSLDKKQVFLYDDATKIIGFTKNPAQLSGYFVISVHDLSNNTFNRTITSEELLHFTIDYYEKIYHDFDIIESNASILMGNAPNNSYSLIWTDKQGPITVKTIQMGTIIGNSLYIIRYYAELDQYAHNLPIVGKMIDSLTIQTDLDNDSLQTNCLGKLPVTN